VSVPLPNTWTTEERQRYEVRLYMNSYTRLREMEGDVSDPADWSAWQAAEEDARDLLVQAWDYDDAETFEDERGLAALIIASGLDAYVPGE
jgi:hypothetical protein